MQPMTGGAPSQISTAFFCHGCLEDKPATDASPDPALLPGML